jgi:tRNA G18 (ribose-2'-O)-methylase SpoU
LNIAPRENAPVIVAITDPEDPRIAAYRDVRERDLLRRDGLFVVEGEVVLRVLLSRSRFPVESLLVSEKRLDLVRPLLAQAPGGTPVLVASQAVMDGIVGFPVHRGVLALARRGIDRDAAEILRDLGPRALVVAPIGLANHDNVGGVFRNAAAFGADAVLLDRASCDPLYRKALRVSVGGSLVVPFARAASAGDLCDALDRAGFETVALSPAGRETLSAMRRAPRTALLLGAEGPGLPPEVLARSRRVAVPMAPGVDSLNVATAAAIALYELSA